MSNAGKQLNRPIAFVGCGVMAESMIAGSLRNGIFSPDQISASHPKADRRAELSENYGIKVFESNSDLAASLHADGVAVLSVKPQRLSVAMNDIKDHIGKNMPVVSIVAGAKIEHISEVLQTDLIIRAMPNTPAQIGEGMTAWTCSDAVSQRDKQDIEKILCALGRTMYVETENMIDMATSLSATGPTYVFMVMEALTDAGVHLGFSRDAAKELVQQTMLGSVRFAIESNDHPAELRNMVTSPGGTSAEAIYQMEKGGLRTVLSKAVYSAYRRAVELGKPK